MSIEPTKVYLWCSSKKTVNVSFLLTKRKFTYNVQQEKLWRLRSLWADRTSRSAPRRCSAFQPPPTHLYHCMQPKKRDIRYSDTNVNVRRYCNCMPPDGWGKTYKYCQNLVTCRQQKTYALGLTCLNFKWETKQSISHGIVKTESHWRFKKSHRVVWVSACLKNFSPNSKDFFACRPN